LDDEKKEGEKKDASIRSPEYENRGFEGGTTSVPRRKKKRKKKSPRTRRGGDEKKKPESLPVFPQVPEGGGNKGGKTPILAQGKAKGEKATLRA